MAGNEPLLYYPSPRRLLVFVLFTGAFLLISILIMLNLESLQYGVLRLSALIIGFLGTLGFGYGFLFNILRYQRPRPLIEAQEEHLAFHVSPLLHGEVPWDNVKSYGLVKYAGRKMIRIELEKPAPLIRSAKGLRGRRLKANWKRFGTPFVLPAGWLQEDAETVLLALRDFGQSQSQA